MSDSLIKPSRTKLPPPVVRPIAARPRASQAQGATDKPVPPGTGPRRRPSKSATNCSKACVPTRRSNRSCSPPSIRATRRSTKAAPASPGSTAGATSSCISPPDYDPPLAQDRAPHCISRPSSSSWSSASPRWCISTTSSTLGIDLITLTRRILLGLPHCLHLPRIPLELRRARPHGAHHRQVALHPCEPDTLPPMLPWPLARAVPHAQDVVHAASGGGGRPIPARAVS